jgi:hypothetical protein
LTFDGRVLMLLGGDEDAAFVESFDIWTGLQAQDMDLSIQLEMRFQPMQCGSKLVVMERICRQLYVL